jgi:hypothetical protein
MVQQGEHNRGVTYVPVDLQRRCHAMMPLSYMIRSARINETTNLTTGLGKRELPSHHVRLYLIDDSWIPQTNLCSTDSGDCV